MDHLNNMIECPIDFESKFHRADLLALKDSENGFLNGKSYYAYNIPGVQYCIRIYPNGYDENCRGETWIFLFVKGSEKINITANFEISIKSANYDSGSIDYVYQEFDGYGPKLEKTEQFFDSKMKYFINGEITIEIKGILKVARSKIKKISSPISMEWKIKESDLEALKESNNGFLKSKRFIVSTFSDVKYCLTIFPNGFNTERKGNTDIFLQIQMGNEKRVEAVYDFSIKSANYYHGVQDVFDESDDCGMTFCSTNDLFDPAKKFIVDGYLTINLNGILMIKKNQYTTLKLKKGFAGQSAQKKKNKEFTILIDGKEIKVHKKVLTEASPVFVRMFESGMKESIENKMDIPDFSFDIVDAAIKLCYSSAVPRKFTIDDMFLLYKFADKYAMKIIMDLVEEYLGKKMSAANVCQLIKFSKEMNITKLRESCIEFLMKCAEEKTPVYGVDALDKDLLASTFLKFLCPKSETEK